jgi:sialic acid synthase
MRELIIDSTRIADDTQVFAIAELGHNHSGDLGKAMDMVDTAKAAGASAVKFQTRHPKEVYAMQDQPGGYLYKSDHPQWMDETYGVHREKLEFDPVEWERLFDYCRTVGITAFSTPFDFSSADQLDELGVPAFKIASGDATNIPLIEHVARFGKPMIVSTGGLDEEDVDRVYMTLRDQVPFALLQCSCIYPAPHDVMNLNVITTLRQTFPDIVIGLSTHNKSWLPTVAAVALGARIFEHHYTNDKMWKGTDNHFSLTQDSFSDLVRACETVQAALGSPGKAQDPREASYTLERQKKLVWAKDAFRGEALTREHFAILSPGDGIPPYRLDELMNDIAARDVVKGRDVVPDDIDSLLWARAEKLTHA